MSGLRAVQRVPTRLSTRLAVACIGLSIFSLGVTFNIQAGLGLQPWWALHYGLALKTPLLIGQVNMVVGVAVMGLAWALGVRPGVATLLNIVIVGVVTDLLLWIKLVPPTSGGLDSYALMLAGLVLLGFGTAIYVKAQLGAGPRDSLMLGLAALMRGRVGLARNSMDLVVLAVGWLMGAPIGIGTVVYTLGTGPMVAFFFRHLRVPVKRRPVRTSVVVP